METSDKTALEIMQSNIRYMVRNPELTIDKADALPEDPKQTENNNALHLL